MKGELIQQILFIQGQLLDVGAEFEKQDEEKLLKKEEKKLEKIVEDLEVLLTDTLKKLEQEESEGSKYDGSSSSESSKKKEGKSDQESVLSGDLYSLLVNKGVNVEMTLNGKKHIFASEQTYQLPEEYAQIIINERLGVLVDE